MKEQEQAENGQIYGAKSYLPTKVCADIRRRRQERMKERQAILRRQIVDASTRR